MSEVKRAITDAMRQRIYEMWISGYKVANIAADIGVNAHTVRVSWSAATPVTFTSVDARFMTLIVHPQLQRW
mgnify:CR=1 FL=1